MLSYILILLFVTSFILIGIKSVRYKFAFIPVLFLTIFAGFRDYMVGTDTKNYVNDFVNSVNQSYYYFDPNVEFGYQYFVYTLLNFTHDYHWYLLAVALIIISLMIYSMRKYSNDYLLSVYIYITFGFYTFLFNTVRQAIALAILFYGVKFFLEKKIIKYLLLVFIAAMFHVSAWIMIPFYFLVHSKIRFEVKAISIFISSAILSSIVIQYMSASNQRYEQYTQESEHSGGYLILLFYIVIAIFLYIFGKNLRLKNKDYSLLEQLYICGLLLVIPISFLGTDPSGPQRVLYNFSVYLIFLIPMLLRYQFNRLGYISLFYVLSFIYFMMITYSLYGIYPYVINDVFRIF
ncbi:EpsG family protein [Acinetobacter baumannii]|uniref:EpsG family protein n=1 Tax=Acinetobacter baumannii TaxID=470 RepID=UPI00280E299E|nr:EpsG family protein [Acinetobacter baumannii]MDQ8960286.1 EpsG family protein [Acinetobacter baumannii]